MIPNYDKLRSYQKEGVQFFIERDNAILADEMGLGKTVQTGVAINYLIQTKKISSVLIVCPNSLTLNWKKELATWCNNASSVIVKGKFNDRKAYYLMPFQIHICTYEQVLSDVIFFINSNINYDLIVIDEAQRIKNAGSRTSQACKLLSRRKSWALSGTPIENNIDDLISLFSFVKSGLINNYNSKKQINELITPYFLRRTKLKVLKDLPPIIEQTIYLELDSNQKKTYEIALAEARNKTRGNPNMSNLFAIITELKQICNFDPYSGSSIKYDALKNTINKAIKNKSKVLLFSQFVETLNQIKSNINKDFNFNPNIYHGGLKKETRDDIIQQFESDPEFNILLISIKAGGVGLNLNSASIVIMYDRWWNPAVENQAIHRAHRFGKKEPLNVLKYIVADTIEEDIERILINKQQLFSSIVDEIENVESKLFTREEIVKLIRKDL